MNCMTFGIAVHWFITKCS